jgi:branched-chain amino acid transport system permease protein
MKQFLDMVLIGISAASIYSLMAISMVLVWRSTRVVNFAQAGMALLSAYFGYELVGRIGNFWIALPLAMILGAAFSAFFGNGRSGESFRSRVPLGWLRLPVWV